MHEVCFCTDIIVALVFDKAYTCIVGGLCNRTRQNYFWIWETVSLDHAGLQSYIAIVIILKDPIGMIENDASSLVTNCSICLQS